MMGGRDRSHHVNPWSPEDGVVGELYVKNTELCDDVERIARTGNSTVPGNRLRSRQNRREVTWSGNDQLSGQQSILHSF